ncbi:DNA methyltransferase [Planctomycetota bacterium]
MSSSKKNTKEKLERIDLNSKTRQKILPFCRLKHGEIWEDPVKGHRIGVLDAASYDDIKEIAGRKKARCIINDPPYNFTVGNRKTHALSKVPVEEYIAFGEEWVQNCIKSMKKDAHLYIWLGADIKDNFQPFPQFLLMMQGIKELRPRNFITLRNQRGFGTLYNWMWVRQELLYYIKGHPGFKVVYTDIPKILKGYYKEVDGKRTENIERSRSETIRPGNVWVDIQQVFYRLEENVPGCYAQKPLAAIERIISSSSSKGECIMDFFAHSGTTLIGGEILGRRVYTFDKDPVFAEITIRRLEHYRETGKTGWQWNNPFPEIESKP